MAGNTAISTTFDRVFSTTHPQVMPKVWDNITTDIPFVHYLAEAGRVRFVEGGSALDFNVFKELGNAVGYASGTSTLTPVSLDPVTRGRYVWKNIALPFKIPGPDLRRNQGPTQIADLMAVVVESVRASFVEALGGSAVGVWSTADETSEGIVTGIQNIVATNTTDNTAGTTGNIARSNTWWRNQIGTAITDFSAHGIARMRSALFAAQRGNETTDLITMDSTSFQNLLSALTSTFQFNLPMEMRVASTGMLDVGVPGVNFHGALIIKDANCPLGEARGLNTKYVALHVHRNTNLVFSEWVSMLPVGEDALAASALWMGNLVATGLARHWGLEGANTD